MASRSGIARRLDVLIWAMIYSGLVLAGVGWVLLRREVDWGWLLVIGGAIDTVAGLVLIWYRSRIADDAAP